MLICDKLVNMLNILSVKRNIKLCLNRAKQEEIVDYACLHEFIMPEELSTWLKVCNGTSIVHGGIYGINQERPFLEISNYFDYESTWKERGWIPISSDNCGDFYVIDSNIKIEGFCPVYF